MSINWVMLSEDKRRFTPLPGEQQIYTSSPRTALSLKTLTGYPGSDPFSIESNAGTIYLTTRRVVYLPAAPSDTLESFAAPILNLHDTHVSVPWFGANVWTSLVQPVPGGNISTQCQAIELKITFKDGGAFDFHSRFERIKERLQQAVDVARESGAISSDGVEMGGASGGGALAGVNLDSVHLDELPAYEASARSPLLGQAGHLNGRPRYTENDTAASGPPPPSEPPRYEDVQRDSVANEAERRLLQRRDS